MTRGWFGQDGMYVGLRVGGPPLMGLGAGELPCLWNSRMVQDFDFSKLDFSSSAELFFMILDPMDLYLLEE